MHKIYYFFNPSTAGNSPFSNHFKKAPPAVEIYVNLSPTFDAFIAAKISPPPATDLISPLSVIFAIDTVPSTIDFNYMGLILLCILGVIYFLYYKWKKKPISPIMLICISGLAGILMYGL